MARKSLRPHLNQIRAWSRQGRTDAWVAHQLEVTVQQIASFKREAGLLDDEPGGNGAPVGFDEEIDLRAADDEQIAEELEAAEQARLVAVAAEAAEKERLAAEAEAEAEAAPKRRARRSSSRSRQSRAAGSPLEGTFDHGEEGYGLWLDPAVADDPVYAEHWAGHRPVTVTIEEDQIVIRRSGD
jgi:hypothetical protein